MSASAAHREQRYENVFCILLAGLAYLARGNADLVFPDALYLLVLLLGLNLAAGVWLRLWPARPAAAAAATMANCAVAAAVVAKSGGADSLLWVLYLLPIYTAGLLLGERELGLVAAGAASLCALPSWLEEGGGDAAWFGAAVKAAVLLAAAGALARHARRERRLRGALARRRGQTAMLESALSSQERRLAAAERRAGGELDAAGVLHDARTPLTVIAASAGMAAEDPAGPAVAEHLERIRRAARLCEHILVGALDEARREPPALVDAELGGVLESALALREPELRQRGITVRRELSGASRAKVDPLRMERVFLNLVTNALQAMGSGGTLTLRTELVTAPGGAPLSVRACVEDTGPGMPAEALARGLGEARTTKAGGFGLGLKASLRAVALQNGTMWAENKPEGGARLVVELPAAGAVPA